MKTQIKLQQTVEKRRKMLSSVKGGVITRGHIVKFRELPRGILTMAVASVIGDKAIPVPEIIEQVKPKFRKVTNFEHKIRCLLSASPRFKAVSRGIYKNSGPLKGHLFDRLNREVVLV